MRKIYDVLLEDGTTGKLDELIIDFKDPEDFTGEIVMIESVDENGNTIDVEGRLSEIL